LNVAEVAFELLELADEFGLRDAALEFTAEMIVRRVVVLCGQIFPERFGQREMRNSPQKGSAGSYVDP
jgi:hypothetical protein